MTKVRVRFAPSPTGLMHIGNIRTALMNYLFAQKNDGAFILRIEDTDPNRNFDPEAKHIIEHLAWLNMNYQEGPGIETQFSPYFQSQRTDIYKKHLQQLENDNFIYRCFCTNEELEIKRNRQIAMKKPPRYDRTCAQISAETINANLENNKPFVWRMKVDASEKISFSDLSRGTLNFDLKNFSDFPLTRDDGSFTFMFANCVDDMVMEMTHVLRGEDHLTNTVGQVVIMQALNATIPTFWHLPILCNKTGKKLSKRDQGFSLEDLRQAGFLPEAIVNYLGIIGGSFEQEILSIKQLVQAYNFDNISSASQIKYDIEKLRWVNHKWIAQYDINKLTALCRPILAEKYDISQLPDQQLTTLIQSIQTDLITLQDVTALLQFYFEKPVISQDQLNENFTNHDEQNKIMTILKNECSTDNFEEFFNNIKTQAKASDISFKQLFSLLRFLLTGKTKGLGIHELEKCLGFDEIKQRICK